MKSSLRRPSFSKIFTVGLPRGEGGASKRFGQCSWTGLQARTKGSVVCILDSSGPRGNYKRRWLWDAAGKSFPDLAVTGEEFLSYTKQLRNKHGLSGIRRSLAVVIKVINLHVPMAIFLDGIPDHKCMWQIGYMYKPRGLWQWYTCIKSARDWSLSCRLAPRPWARTKGSPVVKRYVQT